MQISSKLLLNSAEGILKERRNVGKNASESGAGAEKAAADSSGVTQGMIESRLLGLQDDLREAQNQYSREQARFMYITRSPEQINQSLTYQDQPLFPEISEGQKPEDLEQKVAGAMEQLTRSLKSIQVEMENLYALNFSALPRSDVDVGSLFENKGMRELDPGRVSKLTRDS